MQPPGLCGTHWHPINVNGWVPCAAAPPVKASRQSLTLFSVSLAFVRVTSMVAVIIRADIRGRSLTLFSHLPFSQICPKASNNLVGSIPTELCQLSDSLVSLTPKKKKKHSNIAPGSMLMPLVSKCADDSAPERQTCTIGPAVDEALFISSLLQATTSAGLQRRRVIESTVNATSASPPTFPTTDLQLQSPTIPRQHSNYSSP